MWTILESTTRAAWFAATSEQGQLQALVDAFGGSPVTARLFAPDGVTLRRVLTLPALTIDTAADPRRIVLGAYLADTAVSTGTLGRWVLRSAGGVDIMQAPAGVSGATINHAGGAIKTLCTPTLAGVTITADSVLPATEPTAFEVTADGIWTWFTDPRAEVRDGYLYTMAVDSAGTNWIHRTDVTTKVTQSFQLSSTGLEIDDHNNGSLLFLPDGRLAAFYGQHNDPVFRYRIWNGTGAFTNSANWTAEAGRGSGEGNYSYPVLYRLSQDTSRYFFFSRRWTDGGGTRNWSLRTTTEIDGVGDPWSAFTDVTQRSGQRPYVKSISDGVKRIDVALSSAQPNEDTWISVHHMYGELDGSNVLRWYTTAGVEITASLPFNPVTHATRVDDGTNKKRWISDIGRDSSGNPCILWMLYPNGDGSDIDYYFSRWNGSAWSQVKITDGGIRLYSAEPFYHAGLCFDSADVFRVYLSAPDGGGRYQIQEWRSSDSGATWIKHADLTSGAYTGIRARPYSPRNHGGAVRVLWWEGRYTTYTDYDTSVQGLFA